jgi:hypothetical protein
MRLGAARCTSAASSSRRAPAIPAASQRRCRLRRVPRRGESLGSSLRLATRCHRENRHRNTAIKLVTVYRIAARSERSAPATPRHCRGVRHRPHRTRSSGSIQLQPTRRGPDFAGSRDPACSRAGDRRHVPRGTQAPRPILVRHRSYLPREPLELRKAREIDPSTSISISVGTPGLWTMIHPAVPLTIKRPSSIAR